MNTKKPLTTAASRILACLFFSLMSIHWGYTQEHDFLHDLYDQINDSPMQQKFRKLAPVPAGVVYIQRPGEGEDEIRAHFKTMKSLGFTNLKQIMPLPDWDHEKIQMIALEEGIIPWWYDEGGWEAITDSLLDKLGISKNLSDAEIRQHPNMQDYQREVLRNRIRTYANHAKATGDREAFNGSSTAYDPLVGKRGLDLSDEGKQLFVEWVQEEYKTIDRLNFAHNQHHHGLATQGKSYTSWEDFAKRWEAHDKREMRIIRDILRFKADYGIENLSERVREFQSLDAEAPYRAGGELGLFRPHAYFGVNFPEIAKTMKDAGSFYPSIHFTWHFDQVKDELGPTVYMQASYINDMFKGGWSGGWETTGGPQQFGGEKFGQNNKGFTVDAPEMEQFTLSMLAAGFKGWGLWSWSVRTAGAEVGEYALLDHQNQVTDRAIAVGKIAQAMQQYRQEIWALHKEPQVGVFFDWDNEAMWTAFSMKGQDSLRYRPMEARVGLTRTLINHDIPFEFLHPDDLRAGLANRYPVIYLPGVLAMNEELFPFFMGYVADGGNLVMDMPGAWMDVYSALYPRGIESDFAKLFGVVLREYQYSGVNRTWRLDGQDLVGSIADLDAIDAAVVERFENGKAAVTSLKTGDGTAMIIGYEAGRSSFRPGNEQAEALLMKILKNVGVYAPASSSDAIIYRLAGPEVDHYFLLNESEDPIVAELKFENLEYQAIIDAVSGESLVLGNPVQMEANGARWLRLIK